MAFSHRIGISIFPVVSSFTAQKNIFTTARRAFVARTQKARLCRAFWLHWIYGVCCLLGSGHSPLTPLPVAQSVRRCLNLNGENKIGFFYEQSHCGGQKEKAVRSYNTAYAVRRWRFLYFNGCATSSPIFRHGEPYRAHYTVAKHRIRRNVVGHNFSPSFLRSASLYIFASPMFVVGCFCMLFVSNCLLIQNIQNMPIKMACFLLVAMCAY